MTKLISLATNRVFDTDVQVVKENQIIQMNGYNDDRFVVYKVEKGTNGFRYRLINLRTLDFELADIIKPLSQKFGIGYYYNDFEPAFMDACELEDLLHKAEDKKKSEQEIKLREDERKRQLEVIGLARLKEITPNNAKAVIIAQELENECDPYTDYYGSSIVRTVILGFSTHSKNNFSEMRKVAGNFPLTAYLGEKNEEYENRENYAGGSGYYLGAGRYSGWQIRKEPIFDLERFMQNYAYIAGNEENIQIKSSLIIPTESVSGHFTIVDYSEKAIAIFGETKPIKDQLAALGGRFNRYLSFNGQQCPGWVFPKSKQQELEKLQCKE